MVEPYQRRLDEWKLALAVTPRAGVNTVDNIIRRLYSNRPNRNFMWPRKLPQRGPLAGYLNIKFFRNPFARAVSSFLCTRIRNGEGTFVEYLDSWLPRHMNHNHHGPQFNPGDKHRFVCVKIEEFDKFVKAFNEFGGHKFTVSDFKAGHVHPKKQLEGPVHDVPMREIFKRCNPDQENPLRDANRLDGNGTPVALPTYESFYTEEVRDEVARIFKIDIAEMGYAIGDMKNISRPDEI